MRFLDIPRATTTSVSSLIFTGRKEGEKADQQEIEVHYQNEIFQDEESLMESDLDGDGRDENHLEESGLDDDNLDVNADIHFEEESVAIDGQNEHGASEKRNQSPDTQSPDERPEPFFEIKSGTICYNACAEVGKVESLHSHDNA